MSFTDTSKSKGAWLATRSASVKANVSTNESMKLMIARWLTTTPLGVPVEPEVKSTYAGSASTRRERMGSRSSSLATSENRLSRRSTRDSGSFSPHDVALSQSATTRGSRRQVKMDCMRSAGMPGSTGT